MTPDQEQRTTELMRQAHTGEQSAYAELLVVLSSVIRRYAVARLGPVAWVDDVIQDTLLAVHLARHTYDVRRPFAPWFYAIARSRLIDAIRRQRRIGGREIGGSEIAVDRAAEGGSSRDDIDVEAIRQALASLPPRQRAIIEGLKYRDESVREVAARLGLSESAVKVTAHRGYQVLRRLLGGRQR